MQAAPPSTPNAILLAPKSTHIPQLSLAPKKNAHENTMEARRIRLRMHGGIGLTLAELNHLSRLDFRLGILR